MENSIINFSSFEFPAEYSTKETYEKRCTGKLSVANYVDRRTDTTLDHHTRDIPDFTVYISRATGLW